MICTSLFFFFFAHYWIQIWFSASFSSDRSRWILFYTTAVLCNTCAYFIVNTFLTHFRAMFADSFRGKMLLWTSRFTFPVLQKQRTFTGQALGGTSHACLTGSTAFLASLRIIKISPMEWKKHKTNCWSLQAMRITTLNETLTAHTLH